METDLIFNQGVDLPGFASYPLLKNEAGRTMFTGYLRNMIDLSQARGRVLYWKSRLGLRTGIAVRRLDMRQTG